MNQHVSVGDFHLTVKGVGVGDADDFHEVRFRTRLVDSRGAEGVVALVCEI